MTNEQFFDQFLKILKEACGLVPGTCFSVKHQDHEPKQRERAYAYELYHQLKLFMDKESGFTGLSLHGELDKAGRPNFNGEKPDFLLHVPGTNDRNIAIVEIKTSTGTDFDKALASLREFTTKHRYAGGILLIFGEQDRAVPQLPDRVLLVRHRTAGSPAE